MEATFKFAEDNIATMPLTLAFTATAAQWRMLAAALQQAEKDREDRGDHADPIQPLTHCIVNVMKTVDDATGQGYRTRGYTFECQPTDQPST